MSKKKALSDEDKAAFRQAMAGVDQLKQRNDKVTAAKSIHNSAAYRRQQASQHQRRDIAIELQDIPLSADDSVFFARTGIQHKQLKKLKKGQFTWQETLDLHGFTLSEAESLLSQFIEYCGLEHYRYVMVIHGKGLRSKDGKPLLKNFVVQFLQQHPAVLALSSALASDGGTGALYLILKRQ